MDQLTAAVELLRPVDHLLAPARALLDLGDGMAFLGRLTAPNTRCATLQHLREPARHAIAAPHPEALETVLSNISSTPRAPIPAR